MSKQLNKFFDLSSKGKSWSLIGLGIIIIISIVSLTVDVLFNSDKPVAVGLICNIIDSLYPYFAILMGGVAITGAVNSYGRVRNGNNNLIIPSSKENSETEGV